MTLRFTQLRDTLNQEMEADALSSSKRLQQIAQLKEWMDGEEPCSLVDVRELLEWDICHIDSAKLVPLSTFETAPDTLNPDDRIVLYCYKGQRSLQALEKLREAGFSKLHSLAGGIDRWAEEVDPEMPRY